MSAAEIYHWWFLWLALGLTIVAVAVILLLLVIGTAHRIANLARSALELASEVDSNTRVINELRQTDILVGDLSAAVEIVDANTATVAAALTAPRTTYKSK